MGVSVGEDPRELLRLTIAAREATRYGIEAMGDELEELIDM